MDDTRRNTIMTLSNILDQLSNLNFEHDNRLLEIHNLIHLWMDEHPCEHDITHDYIDLPPDGGKNIKFCNVCWKTFD
jgi:hypothetical protein